jgi:Skp family chaperone for outer membrane proteins
MRGRFLPLAAVLATSLLVAATPARVQEAPPPFLLLNQERLLTGSATGQELLAEEEARREALRAEAREIDRRFEEEERRLTELRDATPPEEFRALADAFDERVIQARREQDERSNALVMEFDRRRRQFYGDVAPLLVDILSRYGAHAIFDESAVLLADQSLNITDAVIAEIDARVGEGAESEPEGSPPPNAPSAAPVQE